MRTSHRWHASQHAGRLHNSKPIFSRNLCGSHIILVNSKKNLPFASYLQPRESLTLFNAIMVLLVYDDFIFPALCQFLESQLKCGSNTCLWIKLRLIIYKENDIVTKTSEIQAEKGIEKSK